MAYRVLHLEDSDLDADLVRQRLLGCSLPLRIDRVADRRGFEAALASRPFDVIVSDYQIPSFDGLQALELSRKMQPDTPFVFVSGAMGEDLAVETLKRGATDYVLKDRLSRLNSAVERAIGEARERADRRKAEEKAASILDSINEAFVALDADWRFVYVNAAFERMNDVRRCDVLGKNHWELYPATLGSPLEREYRRVVAEQVTAEFENYYQPWDRWFAIKAYPADGGGVCVHVREITAAKRAEAALRESEDRFTFVRHCSGVGFWYCDLPFDVLRWDERVKEHFFLPPDAHVTIDLFFDRLHPYDREETRAAIDRCIAFGEPFDVDYRTIHPATGDERWIRAIGRATYGTNGEAKRFDGITIDITDRKRIEQELRASEVRFRTTADQAPVLIWVTDTQQAGAWFNRPWLNFTGRTIEQESGAGWTEGIHPDDAGRMLRTYTDGFRDRSAFTIEWRMKRHDGAYRWLLGHGTPVFDAGGAFTGYIGSCVDITDRKDAEDRIEQLLKKEIQHGVSLERLAQASRSLNVVLSVESILRILVEEAKTIVGARQAAASLGDGLHAVPTMNAVSVDAGFENAFADPIHFEQTPLFDELYRSDRPVRLSQDDLTQHRAWPQLRRSKNEIPPRGGYLAAPLVGHGGNHLGFIQLSDKTVGEFSQEDESALEQLAAIAAISIENARLYERLREQDQRKDEFLATLAHELRNPLAPIRNSLAILELAKSIDATIPTRKMMERQIVHMVRLIDDLLDVSRITRGKIQLKKERIDLRVALDSAIEASRPTIAGGRHSLAVSIDDGAIPVDADPTRLAQIISNLLNNAAKYTPDGGRIELDVTREDTCVAIRVRDSGVGISAEMLPRVFEMFTQVGRSLDRAQGGLGIGLALVRQLVEMHGGSVTGESAGLGKGSVFTVRMPLAASRRSSEDDGHDRAPKTQSVAPRRRILVVDDNVDAATSLAMLLDLAGHVTSVAHAGQAAIDRARSFEPDIVFLDIGLPGLNGYEVAKALRAMPESARAILVAVTGWGTDEDRKQASQSGFDHHLTKPVDVGYLESLLANLLLTLEGSPRALGSART